MPWKSFLILLPIMAALDLLYLGVIMKGFYSQELGDLARRDGAGLAPRWPAAVAVYLLIPAGIVLFVQPRLTAADPPWIALFWGALFGLILYGVYDLTNRTVLEKWSLRLTLADIAWGMVLCGVSTAILHSITVTWKIGR